MLFLCGIGGVRTELSHGFATANNRNARVFEHRNDLSAVFAAEKLGLECHKLSSILEFDRINIRLLPTRLNV
jgi:hypothetical protein